MGNENDPQVANANPGNTPPGGSDAKRRRGKKGNLKNHGSSTSNSTKSTFKGATAGLTAVFMSHEETSIQKASLFDKSIEALIVYVATKYKYSSDLQYMLKNMADPIMVMPADPAANASRTALKLWEKECEAFHKRQVDYEENKKSLYAVVWGQCSAALQAKLKSETTYSTFDSTCDVLSLIKTIKAATYRFNSKKYSYASLHYALRVFYSFKKGPDETDSEAMQRLRSIVEVIEDYGGSLPVHTVTVTEEINRDYDVITAGGGRPTPGTAEYNEYVKKSKERMIAYAYLFGTDGSRRNKILDELSNNYARGKDDYPASLVESYDYVVNYRDSNSSNNNK